MRSLQIGNINIYFRNIPDNPYTIQKRISFLPAHLYDFALKDEDTKLDIIDQDLDEHEIEALV